MIVTARIEGDRARLVALGGAIGAGEIGHRVTHVGCRIEQTLGGAAIAERAGGAEANLHQPVIAAIDGARIEIALAANDPTHQRDRQAVGVGVLLDQRVQHRAVVRRRRPQQRGQSQHATRNRARHDVIVPDFGRK